MGECILTEGYKKLPFVYEIVPGLFQEGRDLSGFVPSAGSGWLACNYGKLIHSLHALLVYIV